MSIRVSNSAIPKSNGVSIIAIGIILPVLFAPPMLRSAGYHASAAMAGSLPTDAECRAVADAMNRAIKSGDPDAFDRIIDWNAIDQAGTTGFKISEKVRKEFIQGLGKGRSGSNRMSVTIIDLVQKGGSYTLLRTLPKKNGRSLLFRILYPSGGITYQEYILARTADGKVKPVDIYMYSTGEYLSDMYRRGFSQVVASQPMNQQNRGTAAEKAVVTGFKKLAEMAVAFRDGKSDEVLKLFDEMSPEMKKDKMVLMFRVQAAKKLGDDREYDKAIADYRKENANDESINLLSIDYYRLKERYKESIACIDRLNLTVGGDPYLENMRADIDIENNDYVSARADVNKALKGDPNLVVAHWNLVEISLAEKKYDETLQTLRLLRDKFQANLGDLPDDPAYAGFIKSPQYKKLLKDNPDGKAKKKPGQRL